MNHLPARRTRSLLFAFLTTLAAACGPQSAASPEVATTISPDTVVSATPRPESVNTTMTEHVSITDPSTTTIQTGSRNSLPIDALQATVDQLSKSLGVEGA